PCTRERRRVGAGDAHVDGAAIRINDGDVELRHATSGVCVLTGDVDDAVHEGWLRVEQTGRLRGVDADLLGLRDVLTVVDVVPDADLVAVALAIGEGRIRVRVLRLVERTDRGHRGPARLAYAIDERG